MEIKGIILESLKEDIGSGDVTTNSIIPEGTKGTANIIANEEGVLAGIEIAGQVFTLVDDLLWERSPCPTDGRRADLDYRHQEMPPTGNVTFNSLLKDGKEFKKGDILATIKGSLRTILTGERTGLNFLSHLCGIATLTRMFVEEVKGTPVKILDTRKTTPLLREIEKHAVKAGGGENHRIGLYDMILIKDNHIKAAGGIKEAITNYQLPITNYKIEVEVENLKEFKEAIKFDIDRIMLDNWEIWDIKKAVEMRNQFSILNSQFSIPKLEVSGGVTLKNVREIAKTGVDYISIGALTHSAKPIDIKLEVL